jgi:Heterokaryon incompatibility protein (HET)
MMARKHMREGGSCTPDTATKRTRLGSDIIQIRLCDHCSAMNSSWAGLSDLRSRGYKHLDRKSLATQARTCPLCFAMFSKLRQVWNVDSPGRLNVCRAGFSSRDIEFNVMDGSDVLTSTAILKVDCKLYDNYLLTHVRRLSKRTIANSRRHFTKLDQFETFWSKIQAKVDSMMSRTVSDLAHKKLRECHQNHRRCSRQITPILPSRVIDVGSHGDALLELHISEENEQGNYVTLSYCWGGLQTFMTTAATIHSRCQGFMMGDLPQSIQDAVKVTRDLGFRFLWVDALCIIQDNAADMAKEVGLMGKVYKRSTLTIAASNAPSVSDGFLRILSPSKAFYLLEQFPNDISCWNFTCSEPDQEPLDSRAWALQESLLSPRLLLFNEGKVVWRCQKDSATPSLASRWSSQRLPSSVFGIPERSKRTVGNHQVLLWEQIVKDYSERQLTFPEDRLPAVAGIATELAEAWDDIYLSGLWDSCLLNHLTWRPSCEAAEISSKSYRAPSWSWASILGGVEFAGLHLPSVEILDCTVQPLIEGAPFGEIASGTLIIMATDVGIPTSPLRTVVCQKYPVSDFTSDSKIGPSVEAFYPLLGYALNKDAIGLTLEPVGIGKYRRRGLWQIKTTHEERAWYDRTAVKKKFTIM